MKLRRSIAGATALFTAAVFLFATPAWPADPQPVVVPVILSLTGAGAFVGQTHQKSLQILEGMVNKEGGIKDRPLRFKFLDDQSSPEVAKQLGSQEQNAGPIVLGSELSALCRAIAPVYETAGPVNYCLSPAIYPKAGSYVFTASASTKDLLIATVRYFREKGYKRFALLATTDASGQDGVDNAAAALKLPENKDMVLTTTQRYNPSDVSATAQLTNIKGTNPQALIIWAPGTPFATALRAVQDVGLAVPIVATSANMVSKQLKQYSAFMPKDLEFPGVTYAAGIGQNAGVKKQQDVYFAALKAAGVSPDLQSGLPWDAALITVAALRKLGPSATGAQVRDYIDSLTDFPGILGDYDFKKAPQRGTDLSDVVMMRWNGSGWSSSSSFGGALK